MVKYALNIFDDIKLEIISNYIFVAQNVNFDYRFITNFVEDIYKIIKFAPES
jgi:DNA polymerase III epsilon subunit-like protein